MFLEISQNLQEKHLCQSLFFNKVALLAQIFSCKFCEISRNTFFDRTHLVAASEFIGFVCKSSVSFVYTINTNLWLQIKDAVNDVFQHLCNALPYTWVIFTWFLTKSSNIIFKRSKPILCVKALFTVCFYVNCNWMHFLWWWWWWWWWWWCWWIVLLNSWIVENKWVNCYFQPGP